MPLGLGRFFPLSFLVQYCFVLCIKSGNHCCNSFSFQPKANTKTKTKACRRNRNNRFHYLSSLNLHNPNNNNIDKNMMMTASTGDRRDETDTPSSTSTSTTTTTTPSSSSTASNEASPTVTFHVVGDAYVDFFSFLDGDWPESGGDSRLGEPVKCYAGGSSVNTATHLKALITNFTEEPFSPPVILHTVLNQEDQYGQMLMDHATKHKIPVDNRKKEGDHSTTGHCIAIVSGGERSFMTHQGVVENFTADDLDVESIASTPTHLHLHLAGFYNIPGFWNGKLKQKLEAVRETRERLLPDKNTTISLVTQHDATKEWDGGLSEIFPLLDFVLMNDLEARSIISSGRRRKKKKAVSTTRTLGEEKQKEKDDNNNNDDDDDETSFEHEHLEWADYFGGLCPTSKTIVTRGEKGSVALRGKKILSKQKPIVMNSIDPTGAGDSFTAGFLFGLWSWKLDGLDGLTSTAAAVAVAAATTETNDNEKGANKNDNKNDADATSEEETWPTEAIEEGMRWGVSLASAAVMIRGASVPPEGTEIQKFLGQAKEPEYPVFENLEETGAGAGATTATTEQQQQLSSTSL